MGILSITLKGEEIGTANFQVRLRRQYRFKHLKLLHAHYNINSKKFTGDQNKTHQRLLFMKMNFLGVENIENITEGRSLISLGLSSHNEDGTIMSRDLYKTLVSGNKSIVQADLHFSFFYLDALALVQPLAVDELNITQEVSFINLVFEFEE